MWAWKAGPSFFALVFVRRNARRLTRYIRLVDSTRPCYGLHDCDEALRAHTTHRIGKCHSLDTRHAKSLFAAGHTCRSDCFARNFVNSSSKLGGLHLRNRSRDAVLISIRVSCSNLAFQREAFPLVSSTVSLLWVQSGERLCPPIQTSIR